MSIPDYRGMVQARAKIDDQLNKAMAFLAPTKEEQVVPVETAQIYVAARIKAAADGLRQFEDAVKGGGQ